VKQLFVAGIAEDRWLVWRFAGRESSADIPPDMDRPIGTAEEEPLRGF
jgi:hypothetical protein